MQLFYCPTKDAEMATKKCDRNNTSDAALRSTKITYMTSNTAIIGEGKSKYGRFTKLAIKGRKKPVLISHNKLVSNPKAVYAQLTGQGARLITTQVRNDLCKNIQDYKHNKPLFQVAEEIGLFEDCFILPDGAIPTLPNGVELYLHDISSDILSKYKTAGTLEGWQGLAKYAIGNTRMMLAFALNFVGPVSAIWPREYVGFQLTGPRGSGKSTIAVVSTSTWGWDQKLGAKYGFGMSWNITFNKLEPTCLGYNHTILFLDETRVAQRRLNGSVDILQAIMRLDSQKVKGRMTDEGPARVWNVPVLSTSNVSVVQMVKVGAPDEDAGVYCDRLFDIPIPSVGFGMFETLHGFQDNCALSIYLKQLASDNHGIAAREFVRRILKRRAEDPQGLKNFLDDREKGYKRTATKRIGSSKEVLRIHNKFATVYAAGCLAIEVGILPFERNDLLRAIITCEQDHISFVEKEMVGLVQQQRTGIEILRAYIDKNLDEFIDLQKDNLPRNHDHKSCPGYINEHAGRAEYLFSEKKLQEIMGSSWVAKALKKELHSKGLITTVAAGEGEMRYSTKRVIGGQRKSVLAINAEVCEN